MPTAMKLSRTKIMIFVLLSILSATALANGERETPAPAAEAKWSQKDAREFGIQRASLFDIDLDSSL